MAETFTRPDLLECTNPSMFATVPAEGSITRPEGSNDIDCGMVDATASSRLVGRLIRCGYTRPFLAETIGADLACISKANATVPWSTAARILVAFERLELVPATRSRKLLAELKAEGFRPLQISSALEALARSSGQEAPVLPLIGDRILASVARLVEELYEQMTA